MINIVSFLGFVKLIEAQICIIHAREDMHPSEKKLKDDSIDVEMAIPRSNFINGGLHGIPARQFRAGLEEPLGASGMPAAFRFQIARGLLAKRVSAA